MNNDHPEITLRFTPVNTEFIIKVTSLKRKSQFIYKKNVMPIEI